MKYLLSVFVALLLLPFTSFASSTTSCDDLSARRDGPMPYSGDEIDTIDFIISNVGSEGKDFKKSTIIIGKKRGQAVRFTDVSSHCIVEYYVVNNGDKTHMFRLSTSKSYFRTMQRQMRQLLKDPWGEHAILYRI